MMIRNFIAGIIIICSMAVLDPIQVQATTFELVELTEPVEGLQLIMFHSEVCGYCIRFMREARPDFEENVNIPLIVIYTQKPVPDWVKEAHEAGKIDVNTVRGTPTFILYDGVVEQGRIVGYNGYSWFYGKLNTLIQKYESGI